MTLEQYRRAKIENFSLVVISRKISSEEIEYVKIFIREPPKDESNMSVGDIIAEYKVPFSKESKTALEEEIKNSIIRYLEEVRLTVLLKYGDKYIDLTDMKILDQEKYEIRYSSPFSYYFTEEDYEFIKEEDGTISFIANIEKMNKIAKELSFEELHL